MMDVAHADAVGGVALIGPSASDWPGLPEWGLAVTSKAQGEGGAPGIVFPVIADGLSGTADADFDGRSPSASGSVPRYIAGFTGGHAA